MVDSAEMSLLLWLIAGTLILAWGGLGYWLGKRRSAPTVNKTDAELEKLRDENWSLRDEAGARRKADAASEAKSRFLATMAHEIRTPLNGIMGLADLLKATDISREQKSYIDAISQSGAALNALVHEILDFSRIEAGHLNLHPEVMSLTALTESVAELLAPRAQEKGLEIATFVSNKLPQRVVFDAARVRQVLLNLAGNAVKFTEKGGVGISVELAEDDHILFTVVDTGPGIAPSQRGKIFHEFETSDVDATREQAGAGLGLAISQRIVTHLGGSLNLAETDGPGAKFMFAIPFETDASAQSGAPQHLPAQNILIVAQTGFEAPFMARRLREAGNEVALVKNRAEAQQILARGTIDSLMIDSALGEMEASTLAAAAQGVGVKRTLILFSPYQRQAFSQKVGAEFDGWLVKPVRAQSLLNQLWPEGIAPAIAAPPVAVENTAKKFALKALLAEDDAVNALVSRNILESLGAQVTLAKDGTEAIKLFEAAKASGENFEICVLDIRMPQKSGLQVAYEIRQSEAERHCLLIAASANNQDHDKSAALEAGFDLYLPKPLPRTELMTIVQAHFARSVAA